MRRIVVDFSFLTALLLLHLVLAQIERVVGASGGRVRRGGMCASEEGERVAERRDERL